MSRHETYNADLEKIRAKRRTYSDEAYRVHLARAYVRHRNAANQQRERQATARRELDDIDRRTWAAPPEGATGWDVLARRDATRFAGEITDGVTLVREYDQAERNQDRELMRALAMRASELGQLLGGTGAVQVVERYAAANPEAGRARTRLTESRTGNIADILRDAAAFAVTPPTELAGLDDAKIERLARTDLGDEPHVPHVYGGQ